MVYSETDIMQCSTSASYNIIMDGGCDIHYIWVFFPPYWKTVASVASTNESRSALWAAMHCSFSSKLKVGLDSDLALTILFLIVLLEGRISLT